MYIRMRQIRFRCWDYALVIIIIPILSYLETSMVDGCPSVCSCVSQISHTDNTNTSIITCDGKHLAVFPTFDRDEFENTTSVDLYVNENQIFHVFLVNLYPFQGKLTCLEILRNANPISFNPKALLLFVISLKTVKLDNLNGNVNEALHLFSILSNLRTLKISTPNAQNTNLNRIEIEEDREQFYQYLSHLDISNSGIRSMKEDAFYGYSSLVTLYVSHNKMTSFPTALYHVLLSGLECLDLSFNQIVYLKATDFPYLCKLRHLNLSNNNLVQIDPITFGKCPSMTHVSLSDNSKLTFGNGWVLSGLLKLDIINISNTGIESLNSITYGNVRTILVTGSTISCRCEELIRHFWKLPFGVTGTCKMNHTKEDYDIRKYIRNCFLCDLENKLETNYSAPDYENITKPNRMNKDVPAFVSTEDSMSTNKPFQFDRFVYNTFKTVIEHIGGISMSDSKKDTTSNDIGHIDIIQEQRNNDLETDRNRRRMRNKYEAKDSSMRKDDKKVSNIPQTHATGISKTEILDGTLPVSLSLTNTLCQDYAAVFKDVSTYGLELTPISDICEYTLLAEPTTAPYSLNSMIERCPTITSHLMSMLQNAQSFQHFDVISQILSLLLTEKLPCSLIEDMTMSLVKTRWRHDNLDIEMERLQGTESRNVRFNPLTNHQMVYSSYLSTQKSKSEVPPPKTPSSKYVMPTEVIETTAKTPVQESQVVDMDLISIHDPYRDHSFKEELQEMGDQMRSSYEQLQKLKTLRKHFQEQENRMTHTASRQKQQNLHLIDDTTQQHQMQQEKQQQNQQQQHQQQNHQQKKQPKSDESHDHDHHHPSPSYKTATSPQTPSQRQQSTFLPSSTQHQQHQLPTEPSPPNKEDPDPLVQYPNVPPPSQHPKLEQSPSDPKPQMSQARLHPETPTTRTSPIDSHTTTAQSKTHRAPNHIPRRSNLTCVNTPTVNGDKFHCGVYGAALVVVGSFVYCYLFLAALSVISPDNFLSACLMAESFVYRRRQQIERAKKTKKKFCMVTGGRGDYKYDTIYC